MSDETSIIMDHAHDTLGDACVVAKLDISAKPRILSV